MRQRRTVLVQGDGRMQRGCAATAIMQCSTRFHMMQDAALWWHAICWHSTAVHCQELCPNSRRVYKPHSTAMHDGVRRHRRELQRHKWQYDCRMEARVQWDHAETEPADTQESPHSQCNANPSTVMQCRAEMQCSTRTRCSGPVLRCWDQEPQSAHSQSSPEP